jgi:hypothetical protein
MSELFKRVKDIQQKAADSEVLVQEICRDIRKVGQHSTVATQQHANSILVHLRNHTMHSNRGLLLVYLYTIAPAEGVTTCCHVLLQLDYAKRHLTHTITSLRRLAMLTAAVDDLEQVAYTLGVALRYELRLGAPGLPVHQSERQS